MLRASRPTAAHGTDASVIADLRQHMVQTQLMWLLTWNHAERSHGGKHLAQVLRDLCWLVGVTHDLQQVFVADEVEPAERLHQRHDRQTGAVPAGFCLGKPTPLSRSS